MIHVVVGGYLAFYTPGKQRAIDAPATPGMTITSLLGGIGIPAHEVALMVLNGEIITDPSVEVACGDEVKFYSASDGG